ncbi:hypothetical protein AHF37_05789 [Paragonimus kellicotti]|nr:hypothetical protein AHF37_05789 [Paragonimus kellicotti]
MVQTQRCDTGQFVPLSEVLAFYESSQTAGQNVTDPRLYTLAHAISVVVAATVIGAALILIPYMIYLSRSFKRKRQREILEQSSIWRKLVDRKRQTDGQNLPYIWFAETQNGKMRTVCERSSVSTPKDNNGNKLKTRIGALEWKRMKNPANDTIGTPNSNARTTGFPNVNLTRIQALHNDHRIAPEMTTHTTFSYPAHEPVNSHWNGLSPGTLDPDEVKPRLHPSYSPIESNQTHRKPITSTYGPKNNKLNIPWNQPVLPDNTAMFPGTREALPSVMSSEPSSKEPDENVYGSTESTPWAAWSECLRVKGLQYDIRVRARENCLNCEMVQTQRCDTGQFVPLSEVLAFYESSQTAGQNVTDPRLYTLAHAISVVVAATVIGAALILIPYMIYLSRSFKRKRQREILEQSSIWRKLVDRKRQTDVKIYPISGLLRHRTEK